MLYTVEQIVKSKFDPRTNRTLYFVKWEGFPSSVNTWEPIQNLSQNCMSLVEEFEKTKVLVQKHPGGLNKTKSKVNRQRGEKKNLQRIKNSKGTQNIGKKQSQAGKKQSNKQSEALNQEISSFSNQDEMEEKKEEKLRNLPLQVKQKFITGNEKQNLILKDTVSSENSEQSQQSSLSESSSVEQSSWQKYKKRIIRQEQPQKNQTRKNKKIKKRRTIKKKQATSNCPSDELKEERQDEKQKIEEQDDKKNVDNLTKFYNNVIQIQNHSSFVPFAKTQNQQQEPVQHIELLLQPISKQKIDILGLRKHEGKLMFYVETKQGRQWYEHQYLLSNYAKQLCTFYQAHLDLQ